MVFAILKLDAFRMTQCDDDATSSIDSFGVLHTMTKSSLDIVFILDVIPLGSAKKAVKRESIRVEDIRRANAENENFQRLVASCETVGGLRTILAELTFVCRLEGGSNMRKGQAEGMLKSLGEIKMGRHC